jgi:hypothetical protein
MGKKRLKKSRLVSADAFSKMIDYVVASDVANSNPHHHCERFCKRTVRKPTQANKLVNDQVSNPGLDSS